MSVSQDFKDYVLEQLRLLRAVTTRRMFGGMGLYSDGLFFALIASDVLYFKVDDHNRPDYQARGSRPFVPFADRPEVSMSYFEVPADVLDDAEELVLWARKSVTVALQAASKKSMPRAAPTKQRAVKRAKTKSRATKRPAKRPK